MQRRRLWTQYHSFVVASKKIKCLEISLTKDMKELYNENLKSQKKQRKSLGNGKISHVHWLVELAV